METFNYCWSHACDISQGHTPACSSQAPGHNSNATLNNPMGGNPRANEQTNFPSSIRKPDGWRALEHQARGQQKKTTKA